MTRTMYFNQSVGYLSIKAGKVECGYWLDKTPDNVQLTKVVAKTTYTVTSNTCNCKGFTFHKHCKHVDAVRKLREGGKL